jgi:hypothetical protein
MHHAGADDIKRTYRRSFFENPLAMLDMPDEEQVLKSGEFLVG